MRKDLYIIVEGETELEFLNRILIPYLYKKGLQNHIQVVLVTMSGGGHGFNNIAHFKNTIKPILSYQNEPFITTMIDHYGINSEKKLPNYAICIEKNTVEERILCMEENLNQVVQSIKPYPFFVPNIIQHEMETLLFANPEVGFELEDDAIKKAVVKLSQQFERIEDINSNPETAPSKRLEKIYLDNKQKYKKVADAIDIAELTGIETILEKCPRFRNWVEKIIALFENNL